MSSKRITRRNPVAGNNPLTYRIPFVDDEKFRVDKFLGSKVVFGAVANLLGAYEDLGTIEELSAMKDELMKYKKGECNEGFKVTRSS